MKSVQNYRQNLQQKERTRPKTKKGELQKCFWALQDTANEINNHGPSSSLHPRLGHQNEFLEAQLDNPEIISTAEVNQKNNTGA